MKAKGAQQWPEKHDCTNQERAMKKIIGGGGPRWRNYYRCGKWCGNMPVSRLSIAATLGSARASRAGDGALAIAHFLPSLKLRRGATQSAGAGACAPQRRQIGLRSS